MLDLVFVAVLLALFGVTVLFVGVCDRIIGSDEEAFAGKLGEPTEPAGQPERLAA